MEIKDVNNNNEKDLKDEILDKTKKVSKDVLDATKVAYEKTVDTVDKVLKDERVVEFADKSKDALEKGAKTVIKGGKEGAKFVKEKGEEFINNPKVQEAYHTTVDKGKELAKKGFAGLKSLFDKKDEVKEEVKEEIDELKDKVKEEVKEEIDELKDKVKEVLED